MQINYDQLELNLNSKLIVAVSGGPDSMSLLHLLKVAGFKNIVVAHLDHLIRTDSSKDAELVKRVSGEYGYKFELSLVDVKKIAEEAGENIEAVGRRERYSFFRKLAEKYKAKYIVTAHHADDQIETVLMNIVRGCGLDGLKGMSELDADIWRPLLPYPKVKILNYCRKNSLKFMNESTNDDLQYRRNFLRKMVVPQLKELNPNLLETFGNNIKLWRSAAETLETSATEFLEMERLKPNLYRLKSFLGLAKIQQQLILRSIFESVHGHKKDLAQDHLDQVLKILNTNVSGKQKEFGPGKIIVKLREHFEIRDIV